MKYFLSILFLLFSFSANASWFIPDNSIGRDKLAGAKVWKGDNIFYITSGPTPIPITTITSRNKPVFISFEPTYATNPSGSDPVGFVLNSVSGSVKIANLKISRNGTQISEEAVISATGTEVTVRPCSSIQIIDTPPSGSASYTFSATVTAVGVFSILNCRMVVREL